MAEPLLWDWNLPHWDWDWLVPPRDHSNDVHINYQQAADGTPVYCQSDGAGS